MDLRNVEFGKSLDSSIIQRGLKELCPGLHFDLAGCIDQWHPSITERQGVYYEGRHICSMDRGQVPEFKIWKVATVLRDGEWWEADKEGASILWTVVPPHDPSYDDLHVRALSGRDLATSVDAAGRVLKRRIVVEKKVRGRILRVGWRHTFCGLLAHGLPGLTAVSISKKFGVDMTLHAAGAPDELAAITAEM